MTKTHYALVAAGVVLLLALGAFVSYESYKTQGGGSSGELDQFAMCLKDKGATFFGAFWCPHCQATKKMFGSSAKLLPYVECSTPDGQGQLAVCKEKKIIQYPTWEFADGSRLSGERTLQELSDKTGCILPGGSANASTTPEGAGASSAG